MKIIHCADIHLDSAMTTNLSRDMAARRRNELLITFIKMNEYAAENNVRMILIAGDLFDTEFVTEHTRNQVASVIAGNHKIQYVYIEGNHDEGSLIRHMADMYENLHYLMNGERYDYEEVTVLAADRQELVKLNSERTNIVMMHGEPDVRAFAGKNIDYLALGHLHSYRSEVIDERGIACYSGCLEGRGFDETGKKGFVLLDIDKKISHRFIPFASRNVMVCSADVQGCVNTYEVQSRIENVLQESRVRHNDIVRVSLRGYVQADFHINKDFLESVFAERYFTFSIDMDGLKLIIEPEMYENDISLKGAFIRSVMSSDASEQEKQKIIELGMTVLSGEEPE